MKYPEITVQLVGQDSNIFGIMGKVNQALRQNLPKKKERFQQRNSQKKCLTQKVMKTR